MPQNKNSTWAYIWKHTNNFSGEMSRFFHNMYIWKHTKKISGETFQFFHNMYIWKHTKKISGEISRLFHKMYIWKHTKKISGEISRIFHNIYSTNWECFEHLIWYQRTSLYEHNFEQYISCILGVFSSS
jgi:hypothetical protein